MIELKSLNKIPQTKQVNNFQEGTLGFNKIANNWKTSYILRKTQKEDPKNSQSKLSEMRWGNCMDAIPQL